MSDWSQFSSLMDFCAIYYTTQLVRCAAFSFLLAGFVMLLRKVFFSERIFQRGLLWSSFLIIPFLGRLKLFYENKLVFHVTWWLTKATMSWIWIDRIYMAGIFVAAVCIFGKRLRLRKAVAGMGEVFLDNIPVNVTDMNVTPFIVGLLKPKIVIPKVLLESYEREELAVVVQHEQTHIRLGHLWFGFAWDILRCLLWVNPFLTIFQKQFRADMEDICDRVCIQSSGRTAHAYGLVLLKTVKLLRSKSEDMPPALTYAGEREFADLKRRIGEIAGFRPYKKRMCVGMAAVAFLVIATMLFVVHTHSYARYEEDENILIYEYADGKGTIISKNDVSLHQMISYDDSYVYVKREAFEDFCAKNNTGGDVFIVFGGLNKLPGFSSGGESCLYEAGSDADAGVVRIPYEKRVDGWMEVLFKIL